MKLTILLGGSTLGLLETTGQRVLLKLPQVLKALKTIFEVEIYFCAIGGGDILKETP